MALYDSIGRGYASLRRPDPRIAAAIHAALGDAATVVNVGAGTGSYEPAGRTVLAVEPSAVMIRQRRPVAEGGAPCVRGSAESLPMESGSVDAAMAILSAHHWSNMESGLREMVRVSCTRVVLLTWVPPPDAPPFWLTEDYFPEILAHDRTIFPTADGLTTMLQRVSGHDARAIQMTVMPIPHDCVDGMLAAYWRRPESYLSEDVRSAMSSFARIDARAGLAMLRDDLSTGRWMQRNAHLLTQDSTDLGYRLVTCELGSVGRVLT